MPFLVFYEKVKRKKKEITRFWYFASNVKCIFEKYTRASSTYANSRIDVNPFVSFDVLGIFALSPLKASKLKLNRETAIEYS